MPQLLSLSRAARLAGVSRGELQEQIRHQGIATFEGKIALEELLRVYPQVDMERDPILERIALIKAEARPKPHHSDHALPEPEVLMERLQDFRRVLIRTKAALNTTEELLAEVTGHLEAATDQSDVELRQAVVGLSRRLRQALNKAETQPDRKAELFAKDALLRIVSASARILPSGHEFFVQGRDSLLEAALKAGLHLNHGCTSGNCGTCKVRVLQGKVRKIHEHDFLLGAQEQEQGYCLACSNTAVTDVTLEASEALTSAELPRQEIRCIVRKREMVSNDLALVHVQTPRTQTLRFMAGQRVLATHESGRQQDLAVASCPCDGRNLQFLIRRRTGDRFAEALLSGLEGQTLLIAGPQGDFLLEEEASEPAVFVAVGDGFAPIKSLVEHAIAIDNVARLHLYRIDTVPHGSLLGNLCRSWHDALDNFVYRRLEPETTAAEALQLIGGACTELKKCRLYVAGPALWVRDFVGRGLARGAREEYIRSDIVE